jgi:release factor glutamine methyltransferase
LALDGGSDGLDFHRILASCSKAHLNDGGILMMEIGALQAESVSSLLRKEGFMVYIRKDLAGLDRVACASLAD